MKVVFLTPSVSRNLGGIYEIERNLAQALVASTPADVEVVGLEDEYTTADRPEWAPLDPKTVPVYGPSAFGYAPALQSTLQTTEADVLHLHSLWMYTSVASMQWARETGRPHVVTIHGMLDDWALRNSWWKKRIVGWLYENANLREADCLQVNTESEYHAVRNYGLETPVCIIPNGVTLPSEDDPTVPPPWQGQVHEQRRILLFLGRIHPKKGLSEFISAWQRLTREEPDLSQEWAVAVVGWDDGGHESRFRRQVEEAGLEEDIFFFGPKYGEDKHAAFSHADAFVLPSHSEGLPMAVLEAWSHRLPVVLTPECNLGIGVEQGAAIETTPAPAPLSRDLHSLLQLSVEEREAMGRSGRQLVERRFTWSQVARQMQDVYRWVCGDGPKPDTVRCA